MKFRKKLIAFALAIIMCVASIPNSIYADTETGSTSEATTETTVETETTAEVVTEGTSSANEEETETSTTEDDSSSDSNETNGGATTTTEESDEEEEASAGLLGTTYEAGGTETLQTMIDAAGEDDVIKLTDDYTEDITIDKGKDITIDLNGNNIYPAGTDKSTITVYGTLTLTDSSSEESGAVTNANDVSNVRGVIVANGGTFTMAGGTISEFSVTGNGGGVQVESGGTFKMTGGTIENNSATIYGGGVFLYDAAQIADMTGGTISGNSARSGGGISANITTTGIVTFPAELTIEDNEATSYGGGVYINYSITTLTISSNISNNTSGSYGGGVYFGASVSTLKISNATIDGNISSAAGGGAYFAVKVPSATISGSSISGNTAAGNGGGLWFTAGTSLTLESGSKINSNKIKTTGKLYGGGIYIYSETGNRSTFISTGGEISENIIESTDSCDSYGGGLYIGTYSSVTMTDTTFYKNTGVTYGGGFYVGQYAQNRITLTDLNVSYNSTSSSSTSGSGSGGGIYIDNNNLYDITISGGTYDNNHSDSQGGAIFVSKAVNLTGAVTVSNNTSYSHGGGIRCTTLTLEGGEDKDNAIKIHNNVSDTGLGGGVYASSENEYALTATGYVYVYENTSSANNGGGLATSAGGMYLTGHIYIYDNAASNGGGIYTHSDSGGTIKLGSGVYIYGNTATSHGGGVYAKYFLDMSDGVYIYENYAISNGGGVYARTVNMAGGEIYDNSAAHGGGLYDYGGLANSTYESHISGGSIHDNTARTGNGGGIYMQYSSSTSNIMYVEGNVEIYNNTAGSNSGGGVWAGDLFYFKGGSIHGNTALRGGGVFIVGYPGQTATIQIDGGSGVIYDNTATVVNSGNDVGIYPVSTAGTGNVIYEATNNTNSYANLTIGQASDFSGTDSDGTEIIGTSWYDEVEDEDRTDSISVDNTSAGYYYTFVYSTNKTQVAEVWNTEDTGYEIFPSVQEAVDAVESNPTKYGTENSKDDEITIIMIDDSREDVTITSATVTLDLKGFTLKGSVSSVITVEENANLTIKDSSVDDATGIGTGEITGGSGQADESVTNRSNNVCGGGLFISGSVTLNSGIITENITIFGSAVYVAKTGTFTMNGGTISGNGYTSTYGGGIYVYRASYSTGDDYAFTMTDGYITGNTAGRGGGIYAANSHILIQGGSITNNTATTNGGGISSESNRVSIEITGGLITGNNVTGTGTSNIGGGILVNLTNSILLITDDAEIYGNSAVSKMANDIYMRVGNSSTAGNFSLISASTSSSGLYDSWYDATGDDSTFLYYYTDCTVAKIGTAHDYYLTATNCPSEYVAYIPDTTGDVIYQYTATDEEGETVYKYTTDEGEITGGATAASATSNGTAYTTLQAAINAANDTDVIYMLCDHTEDVTLSGKTVTIDLNGYTLCTEDAYGFKLTNTTGYNTVLTIRDTSKDTDASANYDAFHNPDTSAVGTLTPADDNTNSFPRAIYSTSSDTYQTTITIDGVKICGYGNKDAADSTYSSSAYYGGAMYIDQYQNLTIKGYSELSGNYAYQGGAIYMNGNGTGTTLTIDDDVLVSGNTAYMGGGIYFTKGNTSTTYTSSIVIGKATFTENIAAYQGGALYIGGANVAGAEELFTLTFTDTMITNNSTTSSSYAGAYIGNVGKLTMTGCTIEENTAAGNYGGMYIGCAATATTTASITISDTDFLNNSATSYAGLGVGYGTATISGCNFSGNTAQTYAAALLLNITESGTMVKDTTIENNTSTVSGYVVYVLKATATFDDVKVINNTTPAGVGAVHVNTDSTSYDASLTIENSEISGNSGYGVYSTVSSGNTTSVTTLTIKNTNIHNNGNYGVCSSMPSSSGAAGNYGIRDHLNLYIEDGTEIYENGSSGVYLFYSTAYINGGKIYNNTGTDYGGGVYANRSNFNMSDGEIYNNTATKYGGGVYLYEEENTYTGGTISGTNYGDPAVADTITGGSIYGNTSNGTGVSGGGIYISDYASLVMTGGTVTGNTAAGLGGGVYMEDVYSSFVLATADDGSTVGQVYDNAATLGQDVYAAYGTSANTVLQLVAASTMLTSSADEKTGIGWLDEARDTVTTTDISYNPVKKYYPLTLEYETSTTVAVIWNTDKGEYVKFNTVQEAVDALQNDIGTGNYTTSPEIILVDDAVGNVEIPGDVTLTINLNGYTLKGSTTAISCYGTLNIKDVQYKSDAVSGDYYCAHYSELEEINQSLHIDSDTQITTKTGAGKGTSYTGTITGTAATTGGGVTVYSGGYVTMTSGQIANCSAGGTNTGSAYGGAGVYIQSGTFVLGGTASINNCSTLAYGAAVYVGTVSGTFILQDDAVISDNSSAYGTVYVLNGNFKMTGGTIENNTVTGYGGGVFVSNGTVRISGGSITENIATNRGGGIFVTGNTASVTLSGSAEITDNTVTAALSSTYTTGSGGGIYVDGGTLKIGTGVKITGNTASRGGGIFQGGGTITMNGGQLTDNTAEYGGGLAQNPDGSGKFTMTGGVLCDNASNYNVGNDIYTTLDSGTYGSGTSEVTLISVADMSETGYTMRYNVWKDDTYADTELVGTYLTQGLYVTGTVSNYNGVQLTASKRGDIQETTKKTTVATVEKIVMDTGGIVDGTKTWDTDYPVTEYDTTGANTSWSATSDVENNPLAKEWTAGYDETDSNGLVRSYDTITYNCYANVQSTVTSEESITVYVKVALPLDSSKATLNCTSGLDYFETSESADGSIQYLTGYASVKETTGTASFIIEVNVLGMKNGELVKPTFTSWIDENENQSETSGAASFTPTAVTVSASGRYNVTLLQNKELNYTGYFDLSTGEETTAAKYIECDDGSIIYGTMLGYGVTLSLWNSSTGNGLKGVEIPEGDISFNLSLTSKLYLYESADNQTNATDTREVAPYIWAYKANENNDSGSSLSGISGFNMNWNDEDDKTATTQYAYEAAPYNSRGVSSTAANCTCYSGGSWSASGSNPGTGATSTTVSLTVSGYTIEAAASKNDPNRLAPGNNTYSPFSNTYTRAFSAGYIQVIVPVSDFGSGATGYISVGTTAITSDLDITAPSGVIVDTASTATDSSEITVIDFISSWGGVKAENEIKYADNYVSESNGLYVASGDGESLVKYNYYRNSTDGAYVVSESKGDGSTVLGSEVYIGSKASYSSDKIDAYERAGTNSQDVENAIEYNYLTAINILEKFDADAYTPIGTDKAIVNQEYTNTGTSRSIYKDGTSSSAVSFKIVTNESTTDWTGNTTKTLSYTLTILYAAKPDGSNWEYESYTTDSGNTYIAKTTEMDSYTEDNLIYFATLDELYEYFGGYDSDGKPYGHCVGILYEFRDCCIRTDRSIEVRARMQVTNEYEAVGNTYCKTNDVLGWTTYRPTYKSNLSDDTLSDVLYSFSWANVNYSSSKNEITPYGLGAAVGSEITYPDSYIEAKETYEAVDDYTYNGAAKIATYTNGYVKTEYFAGYMDTETHKGGYYSGNTLLIYTLDSDIAIVVSDKEKADSSKAKESYDLSKGEYTANFKVTPTLGIDTSVSNEVVLSGDIATKVVITITLPENLNYNSGSVELDYSLSTCGYEEGELNWEISATVNTDGTTTLTLTTLVYDLDLELPTINYSTTIGTPGGDNTSINNKTFETTAAIYLAYVEDDGSERLATATEEDTAKIKAVSATKQYIWVSGEDKEDLGADLTYSLNYENYQNTNSTTVEIGTILPYSGDYRGSSFGGAYQVTGLTLTFTDEASYIAYLGSSTWTSGTATAGKILYVASGQKYEQDEYYTVTNLADLMDVFDDGTELENNTIPTTGTGKDEDGNDIWTITYTLTSNEIEALTQLSSTDSGIGIYVYLPAVTGGEMVTLDVTLSTATTDATTGVKTALEDSGNSSVQEGGDVYYDNMFYRIYSGTNAYISNSVSISIVERKLSGIVWLDQDGDGFYSTASGSTDQPLKDVDVYLYTDDQLYTDEMAQAATAAGDTRMDTITLDGVVDDSNDPVTLYRAVDVYGNILDPVQTTEKGLYMFEQLAEGTYYVVFVDDGDNYTVADTNEQPVAFSQLSVTNRSNLTSDGYYNKSEPTYTTSTTGVALLSNSYIKNEITTTSDDPSGTTTTTTGIELPAVEEIEGTYVQALMNSALSYATLELVKTWENIFELSDISEGDVVTFEVIGTVDSTTDPGTDETVSDTVYTMTCGGVDASSGELTATGSTKIIDVSNPTSTTDGDAFDVAVTTKTNSDTGTMTVTWTATITVPIENADKQEITYHFAGYDNASNTATAGITEGTKTDATGGITGIKLSDADFEYDDENGIVYTYSATNTKIVYAIDLEKISSTSTERDPYYLSGAQFTLYDEDNTVVAKDISSGTDTTDSETGEIWLGYLEPGTYYLKETVAPDGYNINLGVWKIVIDFDTGTGESSFKVYLVNDEDTGEAYADADVKTYDEVTSLTTGKAAAEYTVTGYTADGKEVDASNADEATLYTVAFEIKDEPGAELPNMGGTGTIWIRVLGALLILIAAALLRKQRLRVKN